MKILTLPGVFEPRSDTWMLATALTEAMPRRARVLDVCTGSGAIAVVAARHGAREVVAVDVSRRAVLTARLNARRNGVRVDARRGDLLAPVAGEQFDLIVSNPPYVPAAADALPRRGQRRGWDAGRDGRVLLDKLCAKAPAHLVPGGIFLVVHSEVCGTDATVRQLTAAGLDTEVVHRHRGPLGPLLRERRDMLVQRGLLRAGAQDEEVVVVRAQRPRVDARRDERLLHRVPA
ncbi:MAG TPA: HemK2/MTQ2 family protein methyltransferase [Baekduia sp.]|nr:HemK2/MTQ2 family protein methyltransferase [Baekduia sp.]